MIIVMIIGDKPEP